MDEQELVRQIQDGDEMAFAEIVKIYKDKIVNFLCKFTGDYQKAVDLSQETFMRVYFKAHYRIPVILKDIEGFSQEEIAQIMKRPLGTIKARINRGRNYLKIELEKASCVENSFTKKEEYQDGCA